VFCACAFCTFLLLSSVPTRRSSDLYIRSWLAAPALVPAGFLTHWMWGDLGWGTGLAAAAITAAGGVVTYAAHPTSSRDRGRSQRSEEHTSELQSRFDLVCRLLLEKQ